MRTEPVVITGMGAITPLGSDVPATWTAMLEGRSGVRLLTDERYDELPVRIGAPVAADPAEAFSRAQARHLDRFQQLAVIAAREAWRDAGFDGLAADNGLDADRVGAVVGTGHGGLSTTLERYEDFLQRGWKALSPFTVMMTMPNAAGASVSQEIGGHAGTHTPVSACATGSEAIGEAVEMIRGGRADVVMAGGSEAALVPFAISGFAATRGLSRRNDDPAAASRPFDADRDGFVVGEGAGIVVLESARHAAERGHAGYGEVLGIGISADPEHPVRSDPDGVSAALAMRRALGDSHCGADDIAHVNAHATSTPAGDLSEARAIASVLGPDVLVSATKSMTGHLLGASGAIEAIVTLMALRERLAPPTINLDHQDEQITLNLTAGRAAALPGATDAHLIGMSNSFGFGGHNISLVLAAR